MMALNSYFPMPFGQHAKITVTNEGAKPVLAFYYHVDYEQHARIDDSVARFHAQYRQAMPNKDTRKTGSPMAIRPRSTTRSTWTAPATM